jgi:hypothetical protein
MKSFLRKSKADGSSVAKIERAIRRGWQPGLSVREVITRRRHRRQGAADYGQ